MNDILFRLAGTPIRVWHVASATAAAALCLMMLVVVLLARANARQAREAAANARRQREVEEKLARLGTHSSQLNGRLQAMAENMGHRQSELARFVSERLDAVGQRVGHGLELSARATIDNLTKLQERLAVIDAAQSRLTGLSEQMVGLRDILANKQSRGAFGQGRMEAIVRDGLPAGAHAFQPSLSNGTRPDCLIRLPGDERGLVVDAKFPLEAFEAFRAARGEEARRQAMQRARGDVAKHVRDIAERYLIAGETQELALLFVPAESIFADLSEHFDDLVQKALRRRILIVSPTLLMLAIQVMQAIVRDAHMREQAHVIQAEVRKLLDDIGRMSERVEKLDAHFRQAQEDVAGIATSAAKVRKRGERIEALEFDDAPAQFSLDTARAAE